MKHIFIMNPAAGKGTASKVFLPQIIETSKRLHIQYEIHRTLAPGDAEHFVRNKCREMENQTEIEDTLRFYSCGGDGTFNEVANGAFGHKNVEIAMIPAGTGNDFPKNFTNIKYFEDVERQILGEAKWIDIIGYKTDSLDEPYESIQRYGINMSNIGLDSDVADKVSEIKTLPFIPKPLAYGMAVGIILGKKKGVNLEIEFDDGELHSGDIMLVAIANGCYCGGGFKGVPKASLDDGLIDVSIIGNISRRKFISLIGKYRNGTHLEDPITADIVSYRKCRSLKVKSKDKIKLCTDGEISMAGEITFEIIPKGIRFSMPQGCEHIL